MSQNNSSVVVIGAGGQDQALPIASDAPRAVILTGPGFQDHDLIYCYYRFLEEGYAVDIATPSAGAVSGKYAVPLSGKMDKTGSPVLSFEDLTVDRYDVVVLTGGYEAPGRVRRDTKALAFVKGMADAGKIVAGLCHGPWIMISAKILGGKTVCAYIDMKDDMINSGANVINARVVRDGNIITASYYAYVGEFMRETFAAVAQLRERSQKQLAGVV
ncbi:DJ-1/PfpI family protein [Nostoc sp. FACHB-973]|nr:DJ-1/PfpI family protein [Nostoc sp. FACHB-973]